MATKKKAGLTKIDPKHVPESFEDALLTGIRGKDGGDASATILGSDSIALKIRGVISTQCPTIDMAIGRGGIPLGRLTLLHGSESAGKTTLALHLVAETQRLGGIAIYLDKEYKLDPDYAQALGVNTKKLIISQPDHLEAAFQVHTQAIEIAEKWRKKSGKRVPVLIVLDSMNAAITKAQFEGTLEQKHYAPQAGVYSQLLPRLIPLASKSDVACCWISQVRQKMNVTFGDAEEIAGGKGPRFYASLIMKIKKIGTTKQTIDGEEFKTGNEMQLECVKNQISQPFRKAFYTIVYGQGIDSAGCLLDVAMNKGLITKEKNTYIFNGKKFGTSEQKAIEALRTHPKFAASMANAAGVPWRVESITTDMKLPETAEPEETEEGIAAE